jgi:hypothetical protein
MGHVLRVASELSLINRSNLKINCQPECQPECQWPPVPVRTPDSEARQWRGLKLNLEAVPASCGLFKFDRRRAQAGPPGVTVPRWSARAGRHLVPSFAPPSVGFARNDRKAPFGRRGKPRAWGSRAKLPVHVRE